jgi:4-hydroxy-tetrahydrodipicolinate synthase
MIDHIRGFGTALVTPFSTNGEIDKVALERILHFVGEYADFLVLLGTTGESATLAENEKAYIFNTAAKLFKGHIPLVFGLGGNHTAALISLSQQAPYTQADAYLSVVPYYTKPSQAGLIKHFETLAEHSPRPLILYNVPGRTGVNMTAATTLILAQHPNIIGIKESSGNMEQIMQIAAAKPKDFRLLIGDDPLTVPGIAVGGEGVISVLGNLVPEQFAAMVHSALSGHFEKASAYWHRLQDLNPLLYAEGNPVGIKAAMSIKGLCRPEVRLPLVQASDALKKEIGRYMADI